MVTRTRRGFTMVEVVVTVVAMALLVGLAAVGFASVVRRSDESLASARLASARSAAARFSVAHGFYTPDPDRLRLPRDLTVTAGPSTGADEVSMAVGEDWSAAFAVLQGERCFTLRVVPWGDPPADVADELSADAVCDARSALPDGVPPRPTNDPGPDLAG